MASKYKNLEQKIYKEVRGALNGIALSMANECRAKMAQVSNGRVYGKHTASKSGDYPNIDTGTLNNAIFNDLVSSELIARFGVRGNIPYAKMLEYGTSKMEPRPFIKPTYNKYKNNIVPAVDKAIKRAING